MVRTTLTHNPRTGELWTEEEKKVVDKAMKETMRWRKFSTKKVFVTSRTPAWSPKDIQTPKIHKKKVKAYWKMRQRIRKKPQEEHPYWPNTTLWALAIVRHRTFALRRWMDFVTDADQEEIERKKDRLKCRLEMLKHHFEKCVPPNAVQMIEKTI